jgi:hypothetical protein
MLAVQEPLTEIRTAATSDYGALVASFHAASMHMKACSASFNALLVGVPSGLSDDERTSRIASAAGAYESAREEFLSASATLHALLIDEIVASRPAIQPFAQRA